jgi:cytochrome c-type biogenesis protein
VDSAVLLVALPLGLGLLGFVEPCTVGSSLLFLYYLEGRTGSEQIRQTLVFAVVRALLTGLLGVAAVLVGAAFVDYQKGAWALMGLAYVLLGIAYFTGHIESLKRSAGIGLGRLPGHRSAALVGAIFAFNIPACAGPLLIALLGAAAVTEPNNYGRGFLMLAIFGLALSAPLAAAVAWPAGRKVLERLSSYSARAPKIIGAVFVLLGAWSIRFALVAQVI